MNGKGQNTQPTIAGVDYIDYTTNETNTPHTYFAGTRKCNVSWIMQPVIAFTKATPGASGKGK